MGIRNEMLEQLRRMDAKSLDSQFLSLIGEGLGCSPFEANAVLDVVKEVYFPYLDEARPMAPPGIITLMAVCADEPAGKPIAKCQKQPVCLTVHRGQADDRILQERGPVAFRMARIPDLLQEALSQGGLLTREDLAYRLFWVNPRTITRDLAALRKENPDIPLPLRGTIHDIGPVLTHRVKIVRLSLTGMTVSEICTRMHHSPAAVANYLATFTRCAQLSRQEMAPGQIAFILHRGPSLVRQYLDLVAECEKDPACAIQLEELLRLGQGADVPTEKKGIRQ